AIATAVAARDGSGSGLGRYADPIAIALIVVLNACLGFFQEARAEAALSALQKMTAPRARVRRGGRQDEVDAGDLVPGDVVMLEAGDAVPADARLIRAADVATEESALTGESVPVDKDAAAVLASASPLAERINMVFTGTALVRGQAVAVVIATGANTELGRIGAMMAEVGAQKTPLEERLDAFGRVVLWLCLALSATLLAWGFLRPIVAGGAVRPLASLLLEAVALAVAVIPEGLPAITTITLALGMQRMARRGAIVRRLPAVETLGAATVICSDKTGTLTQNQMTVREVFTVGRHYDVSGDGYGTAGAIRARDGAATPSLRDLVEVADRCNHAELIEEDGVARVLGDPTEGALRVLAAKAGADAEAAEVVAEIPFDSDRKRMTVVIRRSDSGRLVALTKGSVDGLLDRCRGYAGVDGVVSPLDAGRREEILAAADEMGARALRVLALCRRDDLPEPEASEADAVERDLTFLGLVGMLDPPRPEARSAVATCIAAGIRPVMITGDHKLTARAVAGELGMWGDGDRALSGPELAALSDEALDTQIMSVRVFARTTPDQKLRIVRAFKRAGHVVAMTGDGVNDAPALREANIGIAMGKSGTDVARQAADLVLSDDDFATIVDAIREGRAIYRNIQKFIFFLLSANAGLAVAVFGVSFFATWPPLTPLMLLWINLVTNGAPALALGVDPPGDRLMREPPRDPEAGLLGRRDLLGVGFVGAVMGAAALTVYALTERLPGTDLEQSRALAFSVLAFSPLLHAFSCRGPRTSLIAMRPRVSRPLLVAVGLSALIHLAAVLVPALQPVFRTYAPSPRQWLVALGLAFLVVPAVEAAKAAERFSMRRTPSSPEAQSSPEAPSPPGAG
ncbi:MAG: cation-translocating P-type ATPase, partial [Myxococcota bacterium]